MVSKDNPFIQIFIGDMNFSATVLNKCYPNNKNYSKDFTTDITKIFNKISKSGSYNVGQRNKLAANKEICFYFNLCTNNIFYLVVTEKDYPEYEAFRFIDFIHEKQIYSNKTSEDNVELSSEGKDLLEKNIVEFNAGSSSHQIISSMNDDMKDITSSMQTNLKEVLKSSEDARGLEVQSSNIKFGALEFQDTSNDLKNVTCWQNFKWTIILASIILLAVGIILFIVFK
jgi:hypothetical protein